MDGFRERLNGRYDRSGMRSSGYERMSGEDRYDNDRFDRGSRRNAPEGVSPEALSEAVNEAVSRSNREQLDVIADMFDDAKADRMESERAIIDAISHTINESAKSSGIAAPAPAPAPATPIAVVDEQNAETLARIERIAGQNAEALSESGEMLERNVDSLRSNAEILNEIKNSIGTLISSSDEMKREMSAGRQAGPDSFRVDFTSEKDEIIGAVGDNRAILNMIRQDVLNSLAKKTEEDAENKVIPLTAEDADKYYKELEDHVHKECVKCYRNVQQALTEQSTEANKGLLKSVSGMRIMVLVSLLLNVATLAYLVLVNLGILVF